MDVLDLMTALSASGVAPLYALETASKGSERAARKPLLDIVGRLKLGGTIENATQPVLDNYRSEGVRLFIMALRACWHDGPHFESLLRALSSALRQRRAFMIQMRGQLSGARYALLYEETDMVTLLLLDIGLAVGALCGIAGVYLLSRTELHADADPVLVSPGRRHWLYPAKFIRHAGIMPADVVFVYWPLKISLAMTMPLVLAELNPGASLWALVASSLSAFFTVDFLLWQELQSSLSFFIDLVNAYLFSGTSMAGAFEKAGEFGFARRHPLAMEIQLVAREIRAGESYAMAFERLYLRTGVRELQRLAAGSSVGRQAGASMMDTLARQAEVIRDHQEELNRKLISQKSILLLFAMMIVGLPMFAVIVIFPAVIKMTETFQLLKGIF